ncbi:hypothetical protein U0035_21905 [Niabella yanshanensis]|uniref:Uncharacterized protein n=1 Tax=Niabella yanshanensis TaxID=577386 RepID=A0ABZ0W567_9BACT|nr:hypothetical protein [Niabella yanshanensis]WQD38331.1 hypothetical protein U0035_21905 [Niabella yanshanensis]
MVSWQNISSDKEATPGSIKIVTIHGTFPVAFKNGQQLLSLPQPIPTTYAKIIVTNHGIVSHLPPSASSSFTDRRSLIRHGAVLRHSVVIDLSKSEEGIIHGGNILSKQNLRSERRLMNYW